MINGDIKILAQRTFQSLVAFWPRIAVEDNVIMSKKVIRRITNKF